MRPIKRRLIPAQAKNLVKVKTCGIYEIRHMGSDKRYVGSSIEVENRIYHHWVMLRKGRHHCGYLQNAWNKYGESAFSFYLLEVCELKDLESREQFHMDATDKGKSYNLHPAAGSARGFKHSKSTLEKLSAAAKKAANSPEGKKQRSDNAKQMHADGRIPPRPKTLVKLGTCKTCGNLFENRVNPNGKLSQRKLCETCRNLPKRGMRKGFKHDAYTRLLISEASKRMWERRKQ